MEWTKLLKKYTRVITSVSHHKDKEHEDQEKYQRVITYQRQNSEIKNIIKKYHISIPKNRYGMLVTFSNKKKHQNNNKKTPTLQF
jgi:hypothetical protein